jgi:hypothetical protein
VPTEQRLRVILYLPNDVVQERIAFANIVTYIQDQRSNPELKMKGFTQTVNLLGQWWFEALGRIDDTVTTVTIDYGFRESPVELETVIADLKQYAHECYNASDRRQEEIWLISYPMTRYC